MIELAAHERIVAVKDAKGDLAGASRVIAETDLAYYAGDDAMTLPMLSIGGVGVVGTSTHFSGAGTKAMIEAYERGDVADGAARCTGSCCRSTPASSAPRARSWSRPGCGCAASTSGRSALPLVDATEHEISHLRADLRRRRPADPDRAPPAITVDLEG